MTQDERQELVRLLSQMPQMLSEMEKDLTQALRLCGDERLIPALLASAIRDRLNAYIAQAEPLLAFEASCGVEQGAKLGELLEALERDERTEETKKARQVVRAFFSLATSAEQFVAELEETKRDLMTLCHEPLDAAIAALRPYAELVRVIQELPDGPIDNDLYSMLEADLPRNIVRAADRRDLFFDETKDLSPYLDSSCELLTPLEGERSAEPAADSQSNPSEDTEPEPIEPIAPVPEQEQTTPPTPETPSVNPPEDVPAIPDEPLLRPFSGYMAVKPLVYEDTNANQFYSKKTVSRLDGHFDSLETLNMLAIAKVIPVDDPLREEGETPTPESIKLLQSHGYITEVSTEGIAPHYALTSKGNAALHNDRVRQLFKRIGSRLPRRFLLGVSDMTSIQFAGLSMLVAYIDCLSKWSHCNAINLLSGAGLACGYFTQYAQPQNRRFLIIPAVFAQGDENRMINTIEESSEAEDVRVILLVREHADIATLHAYLSAHTQTELLYACASEADVLYDGNGAVVEGVLGEETPPPDLPDPPDPSPKPPADSQDTAETPQETSHAEETNPPTPPRDADERVSYYHAVAWKAFAAHRSDIGCVMMQALAQEDDALAVDWGHWGYATDDPAWMRNRDRRISHLQAAYAEDFGHDIAYDALGAAAYLRMYFSRDAMREPYSAPPLSLQSELLLYESSPALKSILFEMKRCVDTMRRGVDDEIVLYILGRSNTKETLSILSHRAQDLLDARLDESRKYMQQIKETRNLLFGNDSWMRRGLTAIREIDLRYSAALREDMAGLISSGELSDDTRVSESGIDQLLDSTWESASNHAKSRRKERMTGAERSSLRSRVSDVAGLMLQWLQVVNRSEESDDERKKAGFLRVIDSVKTLLPTALEELEALMAAQAHDSRQQAAITVLMDTLAHLQDTLVNGPNAIGSRFFYRDLLASSHVVLDNSFLPVVPPKDAQVAPFDLCGCVERALDEPICSEWSDALRRVTHPSAKEDGIDFGAARLIMRYLDETGQGALIPGDIDIERDAQYYQQVVNNRRQRFLAQLEMAEAREWISQASERQRAEQIIDALEQIYVPLMDYGIWFRSMDRCINHLRIRARAKYHDVMLERLERIEKEANDAHPIYKRIRHFIDNDTYGVAESYLQQLQSGHSPTERAIPADVTSTFEKFISTYESFFASVRSLDRRMSEIFMARHRGVNNQRVTTGERMLKSWPTDNHTRSSQIETLLQNLDLPAHVRSAGVGTSFTVSFDSVPTALDYPHPIACFGTEMLAGGLNVIVLLGNKDGNAMFTEMRKSLAWGDDRPTLILANTALPLNERRLLAARIKHEITNQTKVILMDRVLALFVACEVKSERWDVLLRCALPFQYLTPYYEASNVEIPPEMFFGRKQELQQIMDFNGANLVYGGRQLGKTALLRRTVQQLHQPRSGMYAVYADIRGFDMADAAPTVFLALEQSGVLPTDTQERTWDALINQIKQWLLNGERRLMLLLDEADELLKRGEENHYRALDDLQRLQSIASGRFKFVIAGLHNVIRFHQNALKSNSVLPHLGAITIKPLTFLEADELLERPLSYLGFALDNDDSQEELIAQILSSANYYPGLIHVYGSRLIRACCMRPVGAGGQSQSCPPYPLDENQVLKLLQDSEFLDKRRDKFKMTLGIDEKEHRYYSILADMLGLYIHENEDAALSGVTADDLRQYYDDDGYKIPAIKQLTNQQISVLLDELVVLNILRVDKAQEEARYAFARPSFLGMLGTKKEIEERVLGYMDGGEVSE